LTLFEVITKLLCRLEITVVT